MSESAVMDRPVETTQEIKPLKIKFSKKQYLAYKTLQDPAIEELLYGGAKGGGKTVFGCFWSYLQCLALIKDFNLESSAMPPIVGFMGRKVGSDFRDTTLETWKKMIPSSAYRILEQKKLIIVHETVAIRFGGLDDTETVKKFNSAEFVFAFLDQAEECSEQDVGMVRGTLRLTIKGRTPKFGLLLTANPAPCWLKGAFITTPQPGTKYIPALYSDNPYLPDSYGDQLTKAFGFNPTLLRAYKEGSWEDLDTAFIVMRLADVEKCVDNGYVDDRTIKKVTVCDVAGDGEDECVIYSSHNTKIQKEVIYSHRDLMDTVGRIMAEAKVNGSNLICVDKIGEGSGVYSRLCEIYRDDPKMTVYGFDSRIDAPEGLPRETHKNYKAYAWFKAAEKIREGKCNIPNDTRLIHQLAGVTYRFNSGRYQITPKDELKEILRGSPDRADAYVMLLDALDQAQPVSKIDAYVVYPNSRGGRGISPDAV